MPNNNRIQAIAVEAAGWRQHLHTVPQTCFEETLISAFVAEKLHEFGFDEVHRGLSVTGVVGVLHGKNGKNGQSIGLRADIDALDISEENTFSHQSTFAGKMHACGHDGHTAMLLGAAQYLAENRDFSGTVYCIFQPAEESGGGAQCMIDDGLMRNFPMDTVWGMHNMPQIPVGQFATRIGGIMGSADMFTLTFSGRGAHAAQPHKGTDQILMAAQTITSLQQIAARQADPLDSVVVSITMLEAGTAHNILPTTAQLSGTVRALNEQVRIETRDAITRIAEGIATAHNGEVECHYVDGYPVTVNTAAETNRAIRAAETALGAANVDGQTRPNMAAEDFSFMLQEKPGCYVFLGNGDSAPLHTPTYDFNDDALPHGIAYWVQLVSQELR